MACEEAGLGLRPSTGREAHLTEKGRNPVTSKHHQREQNISRRQLLRRAAAACGLATAGGLWAYLFYSTDPVRRRREKIYTFKDYGLALPAGHPDFAVVHGKDEEKMARAALQILGGMSRFVQPGERVLIKPNVGWDRQPELAANTNPRLVEAVVALCLEAGAGEVWVTDVSINDPYRSFARSGIEDAARRAGGQIKYTTERDFVPTDLKGEVLKVWPVSRFYHEVDRVINMPIVKHHSLSRCSIAMKNWYGVLGGRRNRLHQRIDDSIADLAAAIRPTLTIIDATRVLKQNGPTGGSLSDVSLEDTIIVGQDEVALDAYSLKFLNLNTDDVPFLGIAEKRGLGVTNWKTLNAAELSV